MHQPVAESTDHVQGFDEGNPIYRRQAQQVPVLWVLKHSLKLTNGQVLRLRLMLAFYRGMVRQEIRYLFSVNPNPPKDTDGRREDSGRGWVRELQGRWPGVLG